MKLLTYNLFCRPPPLHDFGNDYKEERLAYFTKNFLPLYDFVCIQELFTEDNVWKFQLTEKAAELGLKYHAIGDLQSFYSPTWTDSGLITLSRFPIVKSDFLKY